MGMTRTSALAVAIVALLVFAAPSSGCTTTNGPPACALTPPSQDDFCTALAAYDQQCLHCSDCTAKNLQNCAKAGATMSAAHRSAYVACKPDFTCDTEPRVSSCVESRMAAATPTVAQAAAKTAYCNACNATNAADCSGFFSVDSKTGKYGTGYNVLLVSDDIAMNAISTCSSKCDPLQYGICVALITCQPAGGDYCVDGGFCGIR